MRFFGGQGLEGILWILISDNTSTADPVRNLTGVRRKPPMLRVIFVLTTKCFHELHTVLLDMLQHEVF